MYSTSNRYIVQHHTRTFKDITHHVIQKSYTKTAFPIGTYVSKKYHEYTHAPLFADTLATPKRDSILYKPNSRPRCTKIHRNILEQVMILFFQAQN